MSEEQKRNIHPSVFFIAGFLSALLVVLILPEKNTKPKAESAVDAKNLEQREVADHFQYVSPLLLCGIESRQQTTSAVEDIRDEIVGILDAEEDKGVVTDAGVYFRELNDGTWFGIGERLRFTPGSLLKVPLAISLMKKRAEDPSFMKDPITYTGGLLEYPQEYPPRERIEQGKTYSMEDLTRLMLVFSDNGATQILGQTLDRPSLEAAYADLGIEVPTSGDSFTMSVRTYASFFRILYNGTYVSPKDSEYLLSLLAQSSFTDGIVAGLPEGIPVAHKFGERSRNPGMPEQLHDCGIVYDESHPYIICVMLRGPDIKKLSPVVARISKVVYDGLSKEE